MSWPRAAAFTLIELLIVTALLAVLLRLALPAFRAQFVRVQRTAAQAQLLALSAQLERWHATHDSYVGCTLASGQDQSPVASATPVYRISLSTPAGGGYTLRATPVAGGSNAGDGFLELTQSGERSWDADNSGSIDRDVERGWPAR